MDDFILLKMSKPKFVPNVEKSIVMQLLDEIDGFFQTEYVVKEHMDVDVVSL